jgi:hypothetical protein
MPQTLRIHRFVFWLLSFCAIDCAVHGAGYAADAAYPDRSSKNAVGVCAGVPQTISLTCERALSSHLSARAHVGSAVILSSAGGRLQWSSDRTGLKPYLFAGAAFIHSRAEDYGDPKGTTGYIWLGPGASVELDRWVIYTEVSALLGGDEDKGLGDDWIFPFSPAISGGIMIRL